MKRRPSQTRALVPVLLAIILLLGGLLALELRRPDLFVHRLAAPGGMASEIELSGTNPAAAQAAPKMPGEDSFAAISARPLFSTTRRPPEGPAGTTAAPTRNKAPSYALTGIVNTGEGAVAIFEAIGRTRSKEPGLILRVGDTLEGWKVEAIEFAERRVILTKNGERLEMEQKADESRRPRTPLIPGTTPAPGTAPPRQLPRLNLEPQDK